MANFVTGKTRLIALLGDPVEYSSSPLLQNTLKRETGADVIYFAVKVTSNTLPNVITGIKAMNFLGFNVTMPLKTEILKYVDDMSDEVRRAGSANTVINRDGILYAENTDARGFVRSFEEQSGTMLKGKRVSVLGAGGAALSLAMKIADEGAGEVRIFNRTVSKAKEIADKINSYSPGKAGYGVLGDKEFISWSEKCDVIINTTSVGMYPDIEKSPVGDEFKFAPKQIVCDIITKPLSTKLVQQAEKIGATAFNGIGMLFHQGALSFEMWTGIKLSSKVLATVQKEFRDSLTR